MRCKNCIHWKEHVDDESVLFGGVCDSEKFVYEGCCTEEEPEEDGLKYFDYEGYSAGFYTGPEFGCIHFREK